MRSASLIPLVCALVLKTTLSGVANDRNHWGDQVYLPPRFLMFLDTLMCFVAPKIDDALIAPAIEAIESIP